MKKWMSRILVAAMLVSLLSVTAFAADRTVYLSGYTGNPQVEEVAADVSEISITADGLEDYGQVTYEDDFAVPVYYAGGPVTVTLTADGLSDAYVHAASFDAEDRLYSIEERNALYFDGIVDLMDRDTGDPSGETATIQEMIQSAQGDDADYMAGYIRGGATATLSEPGIYAVSAYYMGIEGKCEAYLWVGQRAPGDAPEEPEEPETPAAPSFTDVAESDYYYAPVQWAVENGVTTGTSDTTFSPASTCTTAQILTFLWRAVGEPAPAGENPFSDVAEDVYFADAAAWAHEQGLVSGETFNGDSPCTRSAVVTYLWKLAEEPEAEAAAFTDVAADADYAQAVAWAVSEGVTTGTSETTFSPDATCTRGQIVTFLYRDLAQ